MALVARQVRLDAGILDVLLVDAEGTPVAVEAKLGRNGESRREVVGQVIDYVSTLTAMTVDELDRAVGGRLDVALRSLTLGDEADDQFERLWANVGINLRAGLARYVVAIDDPPPDLQRIVRFLAERSNLRVSLMGIQRYVDSAGQVIFVPQSNVAGDKVREAPAAVPKRAPSGDLQAVLDAYGAVAAPGLGTVGQAANYRKIVPPGWPPTLHYEFIRRRDGIGVEIHLESKAAQALADVVRGFAGPPTNTFPYRLDWDPAWTYGPRLFSTFPLDGSPAQTAETMRKLIELTQPKINAALRARE